jgi:D-arginine dehydrogenase
MHARIAIVGGGIAGLSTAWALGPQAGALVLEREPAPGLVSSRLNAAILRTLTPDAAVSAFARESAALLRPYVEPCGLLLAAASQEAAELERQSRECAEPADFERVSGSRARELAPHFAAPDGVRLWFAREGRLDNSALLAALARAADVRCGVDVVGAHASAAGFELELRGGERLRCERLVLAAGAWTQPLARALGSRIELAPSRRHLCVTRGARGVPANAPVVWTGSDPFYARRDGDGLLVSPCDEEPADPFAHGARPELRAELVRKAAKHLPGVELGATIHYWSGLRTFTGDGESFCIGWDPDVRGLFWVAGLAGHGMTCSLAVGKLAAALLERRSDGVYGQGGAFARAFDPARLV